jgi:hypothetical protein
MMTSVYANSLLTVCAICSKDRHGGLSSDRYFSKRCSEDRTLAAPEDKADIDRLYDAEDEGDGTDEEDQTVRGRDGEQDGCKTLLFTLLYLLASLKGVPSVYCMGHGHATI